MNALWNLIVVERPLSTTWQITPLEAMKRGVDVSRFKKAVGTAIKELEPIQHRCDLEAAWLNRMNYRKTTKFRNDKGLKFMKQLHRALVRHSNVSLDREFRTLRSDLQMRDGMHILPSRERLEYVLMRMQGYGQLTARIEELAIQTAHFLKSRILLGHAWPVALIAMSIISKIRLFATSVIETCCKWYDELYQCARQFQYVDAESLSRNPKLPRDLRSWLYCQNVETICSASRTLERTFEAPSNKMTTDDDRNVTCKAETDIRLTQSASTSNILEDNSALSDNAQDIGDVVARGAY